MAIYNERPAIPQEMVHELNSGGALGEVIPDETVLRDGIVREMEVDVLMSAENARSIIDWLEDRIQILEKESSDEIT